MARDERAVQTAAEQSAALLTSAGFPKMPARTLMALMTSETGLTAVELAERLGVSAAAISGAVRYLQTVGIIRRIAASGSRRDRYELPEDAWYAVLTGKSPLYGALASLAESATKAIDEPGSAASARLDEMAQFYRFFDSRIPALMEEWERLRRAPRPA